MEIWPNSKRRRYPHVSTEDFSDEGLENAVRNWMKKNGYHLKEFIQDDMDSKLFIAYSSSSDGSSAMAKVRILTDPVARSSFEKEIGLNKMLYQTGQKLVPTFHGGWVHSVNDKGKRFEVGLMIQDLWDNSIERFAKNSSQTIKRNLYEMRNPEEYKEKTIELWVDMTNHEIRNLLEDVSKLGVVFKPFSLQNVVFHLKPSGDSAEYALVDLRNVEMVEDPDFARRYNLSQLQWLARHFLRMMSKKDSWTRIEVIQEDEYFPIMREYAEKDDFLHFPSFSVEYTKSQLGK